MTAAVQRLLRIGRNTADLDRAIAFHCDGLGFRIDDAQANDRSTWTRLQGMHVQPQHSACLRLGAQRLELTEFPELAPVPVAGAACDLGFQHCAIVVSDMDAAYHRVMKRGATPITRDGPQLLPPSTGSVSAYKFRDPDGHPLELLHFPRGTGDPTWQRGATHDNALGIDHSAISVSDVERSIAFYALLGLRVVARGMNRGAAQQRLDGLDDVLVDVVALAPAATRTPHLELLGYRDPRGRSAPQLDIAALAADRLVWATRDAAALADKMARGDFADAIVARGCDDALVRDPDGHLSMLATTPDPDAS